MQEDAAKPDEWLVRVCTVDTSINVVKAENNVNVMLNKLTS